MKLVTNVTIYLLIANLSWSLKKGPWVKHLLGSYREFPEMLSLSLFFYFFFTEICGNDLVNIGCLTALWYLHYGVKHRPLIAQVVSTYSICSQLVYGVGVKDAPLATLPKSIIMQRLSSDILLLIIILLLMFILSYFSEPGPCSPVWQPVVCCFSVPPANKL